MERLNVWAEQALLGAVLSDPEGQQHVLDWVEAADMHRPWHAQVFAAMQRLRDQARPPGPMEVYAELQHDPDLPKSVARDAVPLAELLAAAPRAGHARHYAVLVAEGGIRQRLHCAGSRMTQAAEIGDLEAALHQVGEARRELAACSSRWLAFPAPLRREPPSRGRNERRCAESAGRPAALHTETGRRREGLWPENAASQSPLTGGSQRLADADASGGPQVPEGDARTGGQHRPHGPTGEAASERAVQDLAAGPSQIARVRGWLRPEHFARTEHGALYKLMRDLDAVGVPVDPVTVTWEAARRGVEADAASLTGGTGAFAVASAREVRRHGLLAQVAHVGVSIQADVADPTYRPGQLLQRTDHQLRTVERQAQPESAGRRAATSLRTRTSAQTSPLSRRPEREAVS